MKPSSSSSPSPQAAEAQPPAWLSRKRRARRTPPTSIQRYDKVMKPPPPLPVLQHNPARDIALRSIPDDAQVVVFIATQKAHQFAPELKAGTAEKGRVDFGDQIGARRLKAGDCILVLRNLGNREALIGHEITDSKKTELLILDRNVAPLTDFTR